MLDKLDSTIHDMDLWIVMLHLMDWVWLIIWCVYTSTRITYDDLRILPPLFIGAVWWTGLIDLLLFWWVLNVTLEYLGSTVLHVRYWFAVFVTGVKCETLGPCYSEPCDKNNIELTESSCKENSNLTDYTCSCKTGRSPPDRLHLSCKTGRSPPAISLLLVCTCGNPIRESYTLSNTSKSSWCIRAYH